MFDSRFPNPTFHPTHQTDTTGPIRHHRTKNQSFRTKPTPPDQSDRLLPPHNPSVVGSIPTGPTVPLPTRAKEPDVRIAKARF